jgi:hypothetical protein
MKFYGCGESCTQSSAVSACPGSGCRHAQPSLPARVHYKEVPGEPGLQYAARNGHPHTLREQTLNYTIWILHVESLSIPH